MDALVKLLFDVVGDNMLPRVRCYFDNIVGSEDALTNEYMGEQLAINEFNDAHEHRKVTPVYHLRGKRFQTKWYPKSYVHHAYDHPRYNEFIGSAEQSISHGRLR